MSQSKLEILVVEDEPAIRTGLCDVLAYHGYAPIGVADGEAGLRRASCGAFVLLLLDVMLPGLSGFDVCRAVREARPALPILMLTARGSESDVLTGFRAGADDYVTKPFSVAELMARIEALLRRAGRLPRAGAEAFAFGDWKVDPASLQACRDREHVELTPRELSILLLLLRERGRIVSRRTLLAEVWGSPNPAAIETRSVDMQIAKLRKKLGVGTDPGSWIETIRGAGYRYGNAGADG